MNEMISFEIEGQNIAQYGMNEFSSIWIAPNNHTWVLLDKGYVTYAGQDPKEEWERELVYHSTASIIGVYRISVILNRFFITHADQGDSYDGWMAMGDIGGFGYFLLIIHTIVMMTAGICLNNNSRFLIGDAAQAGSNPEERQTIL